MSTKEGTKAPASVIFVCVYSHYINTLNTLEEHISMGISSVIMLLLPTALKGTEEPKRPVDTDD